MLHVTCGGPAVLTAILRSPSPQRRTFYILLDRPLARHRRALFVACTRARDHLYVSGTGQPSIFLPP